MLGDLNDDDLKKVSLILGIPVDFVRKDYFVTRAIQALVNVENDYFELVFQGGTSLSKAYQIISRLSEDADFRVITKPLAETLGKDNRRKKLREFRYDLIEALKNADLLIEDNAVRVLYEGRYMRIQAQYEQSTALSYLKPFIMIECFLGELLLPAQKKELTSLTKVVLGEQCPHLSFSAQCVSLDETAAEKWIALTRRIASTKIKMGKNDKHLVRHIYDLYHLQQGSHLNGDYQTLIATIMEKDRRQFNNQNPNYRDNPVQTSIEALSMLEVDKQWAEHWNYFLSQMVYEKEKPSFNSAYTSLRKMSQNIFNFLG